MFGILGIVASLILLMWITYRGIPVPLSVPILVILVALTNGISPLYALTGIFMKTFGGFVGALFLVLFLGAIFGQVMGESGASRRIAYAICDVLGVNRVVLALVLAGVILCYGGVSSFVLVFTLYPIGVAMLRKANIPKRLLPGIIVFGIATFGFSSLPGSPQVPNLLPIPYLGTTSYAAPILGIISSAIMFILGMTWLNSRVNKAKKMGETYGDHDDNLGNEDTNMPNLLSSFIPIIIVVGLNYFLTSYYKNPAVAEKYEEMGGVNLMWPVIIGLFIAILAGLILFRNQFNGVEKSIKVLKKGSDTSFPALINTAFVIGYGGVVGKTAAFSALTKIIMDIPISGGFKVVTAASLMSGVTGSATGGLGLTLAAFDFSQFGMNPEAIHRLAVIASGGLDSLPHCGAVVMTLLVCRLTHKESYLDIGVLSVGIPLVTAFIIAIIYSITGLV